MSAKQLELGKTYQQSLLTFRREAALAAIGEHPDMLIADFAAELERNKEMREAIGPVTLGELGYATRPKKKTTRGNGAAVGDAVTNSLKSSGRAMTADELTTEVDKTLDCSGSAVRAQLKKLVDAGEVATDGKQRGRRYSLAASTEK